MNELSHGTWFDGWAFPAGPVAVLAAIAVTVAALAAFRACGSSPGPDFTNGEPEARRRRRRISRPALQ